MINIRSYQSSDCEAVTTLFFNTIHNVCKNDYKEEALFAWAPASPDLVAWNVRFWRSIKTRWSVLRVWICEKTI